MKKNIFEEAKFGDKFVTKDGSIAIYYRKGMYHFVLVENEILYCRDNGTVIGYINYDKDIVSRYQESIDEEKLNKLAWHEAFETHPLHSETDSIMIHRDGFVDGYKAGYRKAMEDNV